MDPFTMMLIGSGLGLMKNQSDKKKVQAMNDAAVAQTKYSALTGMKPGQIQSAPSPFEAMLQGAMGGAMMGQAFGGAGAGAAAAPAAGASSGFTGLQGSPVMQQPGQLNFWNQMSPGTGIA